MYLSTHSWSALLLGNKEHLTFSVNSVPVQSNDTDGITSLTAEGLSFLLSNNNIYKILH